MLFRPSSGQIVEGIVTDVGWYRTTIRSFEREIYNIPNSGERPPPGMLLFAPSQAIQLAVRPHA